MAELKCKLPLKVEYVQRTLLNNKRKNVSQPLLLNIN